jgi:hypothetical protein
MGHVIPIFNDGVEVTAKSDSPSFTNRPSLLGRSSNVARNGTVDFTDLMLTDDVMGSSYYLFFVLKNYRHVDVRSLSFNSTLGPASKLVLVNQPSSSTQSLSPLSQQPILQLEDLSGNLMMDPNGVTAFLLPAAVAVDSEEPMLNNNVVAPFIDIGDQILASFTGLNIDRAGRYRLSFSCCNGLKTVSQDFVISVGTPYRLKLAVQPTSTVLGVVISPSPQVRLADLAGNWAGSASFVTSVTLTPGSTIDAPLGGSGTLLSFRNTQQTVTSFNGMAVFPGLAIDHAGSAYSLVFRSRGLLPVTSESFSVSGPVGHVKVEWNPGPSDADSSWRRQPRILLADINDIPVFCPCSKGMIRAIAQRNGAEIEVAGNNVALSADGYVQFTNLGLITAGINFRLSFEFIPYGVGDPVLGLSQPFNVTPGRPASLMIFTQLDAHWRGVAPGQQPILGLLDGHQNRITDVTGYVSAAIIKSQELIGDLQGTKTIQYREGGNAFFTNLAIVPKVQDYEDFKLVFTSKGLLAASLPFVVVDGPLFSLGIQTQIIGGVANCVEGLLYPKATILALDVGGGVVYGFEGSGCNGLECRISARITKGPSCCDFCYTKCTNAFLKGETTLIAVKGKAVFTDLRISTVGNYDLVFQTSTFGGRVPVQFEAKNLQVAPAEVLRVVRQPGSVSTGSVFRQQPSIEITSYAGARILAAMHSVTVQIDSSSTCTGLRSSTQNRSSANTTMTAFVTAERGIATFTDLSLDSAPFSFCTLTFTMSVANNDSQPFISVSSDPFSVIRSGPKLMVLTQPAVAAGGQAFEIQPSLILNDMGGNIMFTKDTTKAVGMDSQGREVRLTGQAEVQTVRGIATFTNLGVNKTQGSFLILFECGNVWINSNVFEVLPGNISRLSILVQPSESSTRRKLSPAVSVLVTDSGGNVPSVASVVSAELIPAAITGCCSGCSPGSMNTRGQVIFPNLTVVCVGRSMRLKFSVTETISVTSIPFDIHGDPVKVNGF